MRWRTPNCLAEDHDRCVGGLSCHCECHHVPAPPNLRELAGLPPKPDDETEEVE